MNILDHVVTNNLKNNKYKINKAINSEPTFDTSNFNLSIGTSDPLPVPLVTVSLQGGKKYRTTAVAGITYLWDSGATKIMIKRIHTKNYEHKMPYNKVDYSTAAGMYCTTHDVKVPFCMPIFSSCKIINHLFHVDNVK